MSANHMEVGKKPTVKELQEAIQQDYSNMQAILTQGCKSKVLQVFYRINDGLEKMPHDLEEIKEVLNNTMGCDLIEQLGAESIAGSLFILKTCIIAEKDINDITTLFTAELCGLNKELSKSKLKKRLSFALPVPECVLRARQEADDRRQVSTGMSDGVKVG